MKDVNEKTKLLTAVEIQKEPNNYLNYLIDENFNEIPVKSTKRSLKWPQYIAAFAATGGALSAGTALGWLSQAGTILKNGTDPNYNFTVSDENIDWMGSAMNCRPRNLQIHAPNYAIVENMTILGAALICIPAGLSTNILGRKFTMLLMHIPLIIGWICITLAPNLGVMIFGRILLGFGVGTFCVTTTLYISEIAQKEIRGTLASFFQLMMSTGTLFAYAAGANHNVFWLSSICGIIPLIFGAVFLCMPESPTYLVIKDRSQDAAKALEWLRGKNYDSSEEIAELQIEEQERRFENLTILESFSKYATVRAMIISLGLTLFQQMCGISAVIFFTNEIFAASKIELGPEVQTIIVGVMQVMGTLDSTLVVDHWGRRKLLLVSGAFMTVCTFALGFYFQKLEYDEDSVTGLEWLPISAFSIFILSYSFGFGSVPWVLMGELFSSDVNALSSSISTTTFYLLSFFFTKFFINCESFLKKSGTFCLFSGFSLIGTCFVFLFVVETKRKSLSEIQKQLSSRKGYRILR